MPFRHVLSSLLLLVAGSVEAAPREAATVPATRVVAAEKLKAQEAGKQRLLAKLQADAPRLDDGPARANPLDAPIFHRYDRK